MGVELNSIKLFGKSENVLVLAVDYFTDYPTDKIGK